MKKFRVVIETTLTTDVKLTAGALARVLKNDWYLDAGPGTLYGDTDQMERRVDVEFGKFKVTATEVK